jgi:hypothetical protein
MDTTTQLCTAPVHQLEKAAALIILHLGDVAKLYHNQTCCVLATMAAKQLQKAGDPLRLLFS